MNLILAFLSLVGLAQCAHVLNDDLKPLTIKFEIGVNESSVYSVQLGKIMNAVCESKTKELKISVQASSPVDVHLCNCNEKDYQQKFSADELSLDSEKMRNMSLVICGSEARNDNLEFTISGTKGTRGKIVLEVVDNEKHSAIELLYEFKIPEDRGIYVNLTEFESLSRLATHQPIFELNHHIPSGLYQHSLQMSIEVAGNEKVNMTFMKCGMRALLVDRYIINNQFTFEPGMLRMLDDVAEYACKEENTPLQVYITGNANITGTIVFRILQDPASLSDLSDSVLFPLIHFVIFLMVVLAVIPLIYWVENRKSKEKEYEKNFASSWSL